MKILDLLPPMRRMMEAPAYAEATEFNLKNKEENQKYTNSVLTSTNKRIVKSYDNGSATLFETPGYYALIRTVENTQPYTIYLMEYKVAVHFGRQCAQQVKVWRDNREIMFKNIAKEVFFDNLLFSYQTVITDDMQTHFGETFWVNRIAEALTSKKYYIYYINVGTNKEMIKINNMREFDAIVENKNPLDKRFVITTKPF
jgi:hypothetical protein